MAEGTGKAPDRPRYKGKQRSAKAAGARAHLRQKTGHTLHNVIALNASQPSAASQRRPALPQGHTAQIMLFTGVQIVRNGTQG